MDTPPERSGVLQRFIAVLDAITLTPEQREADLAARQAKLRMWLNHCDDLELLDMAEKALAAYIQREGRTVGGQAVAESEAQRRFIEYADELRLLTRQKNEQIRKSALEYRPPITVIEARAEPVRETNPQETEFIKIAGGLSFIIIVFMACISSLFSDNGSQSWCAIPFILLGSVAILYIWLPYLRR